jgi:regulator of sigma E protease
MILSILFTIFAFSVTISILVFIHEGGHFLVAKWTRVWVHEFAIGFGPAIWKRKLGETQYAIRLLPLGGYVRLAGEDAGSEEDAHVPKDRLFTEKSGWAKISIILAGPAANIIAAILLMIAYVGIFGTPFVEIAEVAAESSAWGVLQTGDKVVRLDDQEIYFPEQLQPIVQRAQEQPLDIVVRRGDERIRTSVRPYWSEDAGRYLIGISFQYPLNQIADIPSDSALARAGLQPNDLILAVNGTAVGSWMEFVRAFQDSLGQSAPIVLLIERKGARREIAIDPTQVEPGELRRIRPYSYASVPTFPVVEGLQPDAFLAAQGLQVGDRLISVGDEAIYSLFNVIKGVLHARARGGGVVLLVERRGERISLDFSVAEVEPSVVVEGLQLQVAKRRPDGVFSSVSLGVKRIQDTLMLFYLGIKQIVTGQVSAGEAVRGPVGIANLVGWSLRQGFETFFYVVALLSLVLGITNLIPFPALDGSRVLFIVINSFLKLVIGRPIPPEKEGWVHYIGFLLLMALVVLITWQDIQRLFRGEL